MSELYIDIGGTHLRSELESDLGVTSKSVSSKEVTLLGFIDQMMAEYEDISFIGISYAGQVENGVIISAPNITIDEPNIKSVVESRYKTVLEIDNDLNCAVMAEATHYKAESIAALYVGTGIGSSLIDGGRLVRGSHNMAFEIGHIPYKKAPFSCGCSRENCIELYASGSGMQKWLGYYDCNDKPNLEKFRSSNIDYEKRILNEFETALIQAAGTLITLSNPEVLVLGGSVIKENSYLLSILQERLEIYTLSSSLKNLSIKISELKNASLSGAKLLKGKIYG